MLPEKRFETKVKRYLDSIGAYWVKYWGGGQFTVAGTPDLLVCHKGIFYGIELKAPSGRPSELQKYQLKRIRQSGGVALILYPSGFDYFKQIIEDGEIPDDVMILK